MYYIPHREVIKEKRETTKLRIVYDAGSKRGGPSLNDCLETGPCLLPKIFDILVRFRGYKYGITSDIKSAFLNIRVAVEDRDYLRFLWVDNIDEDNPKIVVLRFCSVVFGVTCSPCLLGGTITHHMEKYASTFWDIIAQFLQDLYMDDEVTGSQTIEEAFQFYFYSKIFMKEGSFSVTEMAHE